MEKLIDDHLMTVEDICSKYDRLVHSIANKLLRTAKRFGLEYSDLVSYGQMGLIKAYHKFDNSKGFKFMTYSHHLVRGEIQRGIRDYGHVVKFTRNERKLAADIYNDNLQEESIDEIAKRTGENKKTILSALAILNGPSMSMSTKVNESEEKDLEIQDRIGRNDDLSGIDVSDFLSTLPENLKQIAELLMNNKTQNEIGEIVGCSQVHISRLLKRIRESYKNYLESDSDMAKIEMTVEQFVRWKHVEGLSYKRIGEKLGVVDSAVHYWKSRHEKQIEEALKTIKIANQKVSKEKESKDDYKHLFDKLKKELSDKNKSETEKNEQIEKLKMKISELEEGSKNFQVTCNNLEQEVNRLQEENGNLFRLVQKNDQMNQEFSDLAKEYQDLKEENLALRYFARKHLAVV